MPSIDLRADHRQTQTQTPTLSPRLQHAVRLLQMSSLDFAAMLRDTLGRNPFLEADEADEVDETDGVVGGSVVEAPAAAAAFASAAVAEPGVPEEGGDRGLWAADEGGLRRAEDGEVSVLDRVAVETSLTAHLHGQLNLMPLSERDLTLAHTIVESLDDDGYLRTPLEELRDVAGLDATPDAQEMLIALKRVQALDPAGVAARSVGECLLLQLPAIEGPDARGLAQAIVTDHLAALAVRDTVALARVLGEPPARVEAVCDRIRRLDPRPGWRFGASQVAYVVPDVIVKKVRGEWQVQLNPAIVPRLRLNQAYARLFQRHRTPGHAEMSAHLQEARWTLRNLEQRFSTILDVAAAIVRRQHSFLDDGAMGMKPLGLKEIAEEVGVHESTVSRVTSNKYMATPVGVLALKYFFSRAMISTNGSACSGTAIRGLIKHIIEAESPDAPLSDAEITRELAQQGLVVARRTVTKYRQMLRIEAVDRRRRIA